MAGIELPEIIILILILGIWAFCVWPYYKIFEKAGFSGWLALTQFVPVINIIVIFIFAFSDWPALKSKINK